MQKNIEFVDLLEERRKDSDIMWISRPMNPLTPHKLPEETKYSRKQTINAVLNNPRVMLVVKSLAVTSKLKKSIKNQARDIINEIASNLHLPTVRWIGLFITKFLKRIFLSIYTNERYICELKKQMQISQVQYVYVPSHRSYLDFILLSYILFSYDMALPNIASGMDFYRMKIVGELLRKTGAFYMRRSFSNDILYKEIFKAYVGSIVGHSDRGIEFFIEGTRSRSQKSIVPKYGLLLTILESLLQGDVPDIQFVPMSISYERPPEELLFVYELLGVPKPKESTTGLLKALSILQKPYAYGRVFFNIAEPISAATFLKQEHRKARVLTPDFKLPSSVLENLAYSVIESHKRNTILTPINLIALLFNENIQTSPGNLYTLETLMEDYAWCENFVTMSLNATVHPTTKHLSKDGVKEVIIDSLKLHEELIELDSSNVIRLKPIHKAGYTGNVRGHTLTAETMQLAVPAINISIYVNPVFAFLTRAAMTSLTVSADGTEFGEALKRYKLIRTLLSTEFALPLKLDESQMKVEWQESLNILLSTNCFYVLNNSLHLGQNTKLFSLLHNVILPFVDAAHMTCKVLFEWNEQVAGPLKDQKILIETQRRVEETMLAGKKWCKHPYSLALDLFSSTITNLSLQGILRPCEDGVYLADKIDLARLLAELQQLPLQCSPGFYLNAFSSMISTPAQIQAKL